MKKLKTCLCFLFFVAMLFVCTTTHAQKNLTINGTVEDGNHQPLKSATVFISGSEKMTMTDEKGRFTLTNLSPGNFQVSASMLGYSPLTEWVSVHGTSVVVNVVLETKSIVLSTVKIGSSRAWARNYEVFKDQFLGRTKNGLQCTIINPEVLSFGTTKSTLNAETDDFLIIENKRLGYRIRYRLKYFNYNTDTQNLGFDGEAGFEPLDNKADKNNKWEQNRLETYKGSMMHFLRSAYNNTALKQGFLTYTVFKETPRFTMLAAKYTEVNIDRRPIKFDTIATIIDDSFLALKAKQLYVVYDPSAAAAAIKKPYDKPKDYTLTLDKGSTLKFYLDKAIIDERGSYADYRTFLIKGDWSRIRIGDRLPFEYQPPK